MERQSYEALLATELDLVSSRYAAGEVSPEGEARYGRKLGKEFAAQREQIERAVREAQDEAGRS